MKTISFQDLDPSSHTTFSFYEFFASDGLVVVGAPQPEQASVLAAQLMMQPVSDIAPLQLDEFTALILTHGLAIAKNPWVSTLAEYCAHGFCELFGNEAHRAQRMRLTRLAMLLRELQDIDACSLHVSESVISSKNPWDCLTSRTILNEQWVVSCDDDNVRLVRDQCVVWSQRLGLPTQLDELGCVIWIGSHYSKGGHTLINANDSVKVQHVAHSKPLVLAFTNGLKQLALDNQGGLWEIEPDCVGKQLAQLPMTLVHRARVVGDSLYAFDWSRPFVGVLVNLNNMQMTAFHTGGIMVCNDVCQSGGSLYAVCKLQGRVFKLDTAWNTLGTKLGAGRGPGRLYDPIMVRAIGANQLEVLSWFSGKLTRLEAFSN